jgi:transcriptional regulator
MHPTAAFRQQPEAEARALAAARGFGVLTASGPEAPLAAHLPFLLEGDGAEAHPVRSNPLARALRDGALPALLVVSGADGHVSPGWYGTEDRVPTWNHLAVHLRGSLALLPETDVRAHLDRLSARFDAALLPKRPSAAGKMTPETLERMMRSIVPCEVRAERVGSTAKLDQNRTPAGRAGAATIAASGTHGMETAALMHGVAADG